MKKELYEELDLEVIRFRTEDIITTSDAVTDTGDDMNDDNNNDDTTGDDTTGGKTTHQEQEETVTPTVS